MAVATVVELPDSLHETLRQRAEESGTSIDTLIVRAVEDTYSPPKKGKRLTGPIIRDRGPRGPLYPRDENPHDLILP